MDPLRAVGTYFGVGNNAFVLGELANHPATSTGRTPGSLGHLNSASPQNLAQQLPKLDLDPTRLASDKKYLLDSMNRILSRAREYFKHGWFAEAEQHYGLFFQYQSFYGTRISTLAKVYFPALFERAWLNVLIGQDKQAEQVQNEALLKFLEQFNKPASGLEKPENRLVRLFTQELQSLKQLPSAENLDAHVSVATLSKLAKKLISQGLRAEAVTIYGFVQVRQLFSLYQTERLTQQLAQQAGFSPEESAHQLLLPEYVPWVPVLPTTPEDKARTQSKKTAPPAFLDYYAERVDPIDALNRDPNEDAEQRKRQRRLAEYLKRKKTLKVEKSPAQKPQITNALASAEGLPEAAVPKTRRRPALPKTTDPSVTANPFALSDWHLKDFDELGL